MESTNKKLFGIDLENTDVSDIDTQELSDYLCCQGICSLTEN